MCRLVFILCLLSVQLVGEVDYSLYFVTSRGEESTEWMTEVIEKAVQGGATIVQIDERGMEFEVCVAFAKHLVKLLAPYKIPLIINSRIDVAKASGAQGVHFLCYEPPLLNEARKTLGQDAIIGFSASAKNRKLAIEGLTHDTIANYISMGPVFPSKTYPHLTPWGLEGLSHARTLTSKPLLAVGGIRLNNAADAIHAGADGIVVVSAIQNAPDPTAAASQLLTTILDTRSP